MSEQTIIWPGKTGKYTYWIHDLPPDFTSGQPGNYIFAKKNGSGKWTPVYVGITEDLGERFDNHHKEKCIIGSGTTHIHAHTNSSKVNRANEENDLLEYWTPPCNG
ncbi:MAG: GIY-YIG nuclease family protein [Proteobacteria bacterium]|nr:GIY-YIG nuclease family protein [Pseudomonadota bacterium]